MNAPDPSGGIYVHLPFCPYVCPYCDFAKWPMRRSDAQRYLLALQREIDDAPALPVRTLFLGGGTPNTYDATDIASLVRRLGKRFAPHGFEETTIELNPDGGLCSEATFAAYGRAGVDRLSFGVQSFDARELERLGRRHDAADVTRAFELARGAGFSNLSLDLIFGIPGQDTESWRRSLEAALALEPAHISTYGLTIEPDTPYAQWFSREPDAFASNDLEADLYALAITTLESAGFEHYEISNFARAGRRSIHNANYWANGDYLGFGVGAASFRDGVRSVHTRDREVYVAAVVAGTAIPSDDERLEPVARAGEAAMLALRTAEGVDVARFAERYRVDFLEFYAPVVAEWRASGTLDVTPTHVRLTRRGRFVANDVCGAFVTFAGS